MRKWLAGALVAVLALSGCAGKGFDSPVFGAVFGLSGAPVTPHTIGKIPEPEAHAGDRLIGRAANNPGLCIFENAGGRRFRSACP